MRIPTLNFICPICSAKPQEECKLTTGAPRFDSHLERKWIAKDYSRGNLESETIRISEVPGRRPSELE
jgi:hypothetical protein